MNRLYYILPLLLLPLVLAQPPTTWKLPFSIYRLIYNFTLTQNATDLYVHVVIPTNIIDQYLTYWQSKGINVSQFPELLIPRVYYYNETTGQEVMVQNQITCLSTYRGYCHNFTIYFPSLPAGTHYITIYMPAFFWEDFEDNPLNAQISNVGECFNDGWCIISAAATEQYVKIESNGQDPTQSRHIHFHAYSYRAYDIYYIIVNRMLNISISPVYPLLAEYDIKVTSDNFPNGCDIWLGFEFLLRNNSTVVLRYKVAGTRNYIPSYLNVCGTVPININANIYTHLKHNLLQDLTTYCGIPASDVIKLLRLYIVVHYYYHVADAYIDNILIYPAIET